MSPQLPHVATAFGLLCVAIALPAQAADLTSASFRMRGLHESSIAARALTSAGPRFSASGVAAGQADALGFAGGASSLTTSAPGFWPIAAEAFPHHDVDGDGVASWLDSDDDGDGLADAVETDTGLLVSASDTGTSAVDADTDDDGFDDGVEIDEGSNPNDPLSTPDAPAVPFLPGALVPLLVLSLAFAPRALRRTHRRSTC
jgi:hypothetical protein